MIKNRVIPILWGHRHRELCYTASEFQDSNQQANWIESGHQLSVLTIDVSPLTEPLPWMRYLSDYFADLQDISYCFSRFRPGTYFPMHFDRYGFYSHQHNVTDLSRIRRYILFLEDAVPGHLLQIGKQMYHDWPAGLCVGWQNDQTHMAANLALSDRYTLQITGTVTSPQHG